MKSIPIVQSKEIISNNITIREDSPFGKPEIKTVEEILELLKTLKRSIYSADTTGQDIIIKDLYKQINKIIKEFKNQSPIKDVKEGEDAAKNYLEHYFGHDDNRIEYVWIKRAFIAGFEYSSQKDTPVEDSDGDNADGFCQCIFPIFYKDDNDNKICPKCGKVVSQEVIDKHSKK